MTPRVALTLALVFHELTTNAVEVRRAVGAGGPDRGELAHRARAPRSRRCCGSNGASAAGRRSTAPARRGFGSRFIEGSVAAELQGMARLHFDAAGLRCTMEIPHEVAMPVDGSE